MEELVQELECPLSLELLQDPVAVPCCRRTFSRDSLSFIDVCPLCRTSLKDFDIKTAPVERQIANIVEIVQKLRLSKPPNDEKKEGVMLRWQDDYDCLPERNFPMSLETVKQRLASLPEKHRAFLFRCACKQDLFDFVRLLYPTLSDGDIAVNTFSDLCRSSQGLVMVREIFAQRNTKCVARYVYSGAVTYRVMDLVKTRCGLDMGEGRIHDYYGFISAANRKDAECAHLFFEGALNYICSKYNPHHSHDSRCEVQLTCQLKLNGWAVMQQKLEQLVNDLQERSKI